MCVYIVNDNDNNNYTPIYIGSTIILKLPCELYTTTSSSYCHLNIITTAVTNY